MMDFSPFVPLTVFNVLTNSNVQQSRNNFGCKERTRFLSNSVDLLITNTNKVCHCFQTNSVWFNKRNPAHFQPSSLCRCEFFLT